MIKTYKAIKEALGRRLKPPLTEAEHRDLDASREIDRLGSGQLSIDGLAETIKNKRLAYGVTPLREVTVKQRGGQPVELRQRALADVVSADAADFESVRTFRRDFLSSGLLSPDDIESWVQAQCRRDGPHSTVVSAVLPPDSPSLSVDLRIDPPAAFSSFMKVEHVYLHYGAPPFEWPRSVPITLGGTLDRLLRASKELSQAFGWQPAQAASFILCGLSALPSLFRYGFKQSRVPALTRITLEVDPVLSPAELSRMYGRIRTSVFGKKYRTQSRKHQTLAAFMVSRQGDTLAKAMAEWNKAHPTWRYKQVSNFGRDAKVAHDRILCTGVQFVDSMKVMFGGTK